MSGYQITNDKTTAPVSATGGLTWTKKGYDKAATKFSYTDGINIPTGVTATTQEWALWQTRTLPD